MRTLTLILLLLMTSLPAFAHKDRIEKLQTLVVQVKTGESVTFAISNANVSTITIHVGSANYRVPEIECAKLHDIRFDTVCLLWNGSFESASKADYFHVQFDMGAESARAFGELPSVQLMFEGGKFERATIAKKTGEGSWQDSKL
jgi:hypothetical protein